MHYLAGTDSVHTTAALCDYLEDRATSDDAVTVVAVVDETTARQDAREALTVAPVRLAGVGTVETAVHEGTPASVLPALAADIDADELVVGAHSAAPASTASVGSTATALLERSSRPVVVVPIPSV